MPLDAGELGHIPLRRQYSAGFSHAGPDIRPQARANSLPYADQFSKKTVTDSYFSRDMVWFADSQKLFLNDGFSRRAPRMITLAPWHEAIFLAADGQHTVGEFITELATRYYGGIVPAGLAEQTHGIIKELVAEEIVRLRPTPQPLPPYFAEDYRAQPPEVRAEQLRQDGRVPSPG